MGLRWVSFSNNLLGFVFPHTSDVISGRALWSYRPMQVSLTPFMR